MLSTLPLALLPSVPLAVPPASTAAELSLAKASDAAAVVVLMLRLTMLLVSTKWPATLSALAL